MTQNSFESFRPSIFFFFFFFFPNNSGGFFGSKLKFFDIKLDFSSTKWKVFGTKLNFFSCTYEPPYLHVITTFFSQVNKSFAKMKQTKIS